MRGSIGRQHTGTQALIIQTSTGFLSYSDQQTNQKLLCLLLPSTLIHLCAQINIFIYIRPEHSCCEDRLSKKSFWRRRKKQLCCLKGIIKNFNSGTDYSEMHLGTGSIWLMNKMFSLNSTKSFFFKHITIRFNHKVPFVNIMN